MCFTCRGGSRGVGCLTTLCGLVALGGSAKERPSRAWGEGRGRGGGGARFDECIEDSGSGRFDLSCFTRVCWKHVGNMLELCWNHAGNMLSAVCVPVCQRASVSLRVCMPACW